jgi:hypothetical protein
MVGRGWRGQKPHIEVLLAPGRALGLCLWMPESKVGILVLEKQ